MNKGPTSISALMTEPLFAAAQVSQLRLIDGRQSVPTFSAMAHPFISFQSLVPTNKAFTESIPQLPRTSMAPMMPGSA